MDDQKFAAQVLGVGQDGTHVDVDHNSLSFRDYLCGRVDADYVITYVVVLMLIIIPYLFVIIYVAALMLIM